MNKQRLSNIDRTTPVVGASHHPGERGRQSGPALASGPRVKGSVVELNRQADMAHVLTCMPQIPD
jgi:hypothetical protein